MAKTLKGVRNEIELEAMQLNPGERIRIKCPACGGGSSNEESLSINKTEDGDLFWVCFRDACKIKGGSNKATHTAISKKVKEVKSKKELSIEKFLSKRLDRAPAHIAEMVQGRYDLNIRPCVTDWLKCPEQLVFVKWTTDFSTPSGDESTAETGRLAIPIFDPLFTVHGYDLKDITKTQTPKSLTMKLPEYKGGAWFRLDAEASESCIVVEDTISAMAAKIDLGVDAVALLGTTLNEETAEQINSLQYKKVFIALDNDAIATGIKMVASGLINNAALLPLHKDIKDMTHEERLTMRGVWT